MPPPDPIAIVTKLYPHDGFGRCRAYASLILPANGIALHGVRVVEREDGSLFVQMPQQRNHLGQWFPAVQFVERHVEEAIKDAVLAAYNE